MVQVSIGPDRHGPAQRLLQPLPETRAADDEAGVEQRRERGAVRRGERLRELLASRVVARRRAGLEADALRNIDLIVFSCAVVYW